MELDDYPYAKALYHLMVGMQVENFNHIQSRAYDLRQLAASMPVDEGERELMRRLLVTFNRWQEEYVR